MFTDWLRRLLAPRPIVESISEVKTGGQHLKGRIKAGPEQLRSPVKGVPCVAFFYKAWYPTMGRTGVIERVLKTAEVYAPLFYLELEGGSVRVIPRKTGSFDSAEHRELSSAGYRGFQAMDQPIKIGERVSIEGRVVKDADGFAIKPSEIHFVKDKEPTRKPTRAAKKRANADQ